MCRRTILCSQPKISFEKTNSSRDSSQQKRKKENVDLNSIIIRMLMLTHSIVEFTTHHHLCTRTLKSFLCLQFYGCFNFAEEIYWFLPMETIEGNIFCSFFCNRIDRFCTVYAVFIYEQITTSFFALFFFGYLHQLDFVPKSTLCPFSDAIFEIFLSLISLSKFGWWSQIIVQKSSWLRLLLLIFIKKSLKIQNCLQFKIRFNRNNNILLLFWCANEKVRTDCVVDFRWKAVSSVVVRSLLALAKRTFSI